jgi:urease accessory protein
MHPWALLQLADSAFPTGGYAVELDDARHRGVVKCGPELVAYVEDALRASGAAGLPFVRAARANPAAHAAVDAVCDAATRAEANRMSRDQGQAFLAAAAVFSPETSRLAEEARRLQLAGHLAPAFGAVLGLLGATDDEASQAFLFLCARGLFSAGARLGIVGPVEAQALLAHVAPAMAEVLAIASAVVPEPPPEQPPEEPPARPRSRVSFL